MANKNELATMLIRFYNMQAGTSLRCNNENNQRFVIEALDKAGDDVSGLKSHVREWVNSHTHEAQEEGAIARCFAAYHTATEQVSQPAPTEQAVSTSLGIIEQAVAQVVAAPIQEKVEAQVLGAVEQKVRDFIQREYGSIERRVTTVIDGVPHEMAGVVHEKFDTVLKFVANNEPVFLTGAAGCGKNVICKQVADALGLKFYFTNAVTQEYKITGFTDAMGAYQPTQFYKAFTEGGVFMLDEMDASIPEVLVILNAAIANRYFDFPAPIGYVEAHPDFRVVAAGNTFGHGANIQYVGRNQLDMASLDRFAVVEVDYSDAIERSVAEGNEELLRFCRAFREAANEAGIQIVVSYRAIGRLAKMSKVLELEEAIKTCLVKSLEHDDLNIIKEKIRTSEYGEFGKAFRRAVAA